MGGDSRNAGLPPDDVIVRRLTAGDEAMFAQLLDAWSHGMMRAARAYVATWESAEDVVQDTWLAVLRGIDRFEGRSSLRTWTYGILVNTAKTRGVKESRTVPLASLAPEDRPDRRPRALPRSRRPVPGALEGVPTRVAVGGDRDRGPGNAHPDRGGNR